MLDHVDIILTSYCPLKRVGKAKRSDGKRRINYSLIEWSKGFYTHITYHSTNPRLKGWDMGHGILDGFYLNLINQTHRPDPFPREEHRTKSH